MKKHLCIKKLTSIFLAALLCFLIPASASAALAPADDNQFSGIDVSKWQGDIDFSRVAAQGIEAVYIRSSSGTDYQDPQFERNYESAKAAGLKVGFYHAMTARNTSEAVREARYFYSLIAGKQMDLVPAMDFVDIWPIPSSGEQYHSRFFTGTRTVMWLSSGNLHLCFGSDFRL